MSTSATWNVPQETQRAVAPLGQFFSSGKALGQFFERVPPLADDAFRVERLLATARMFLTVAAAVTYDFTVPSGQSHLLLLTGYAAYSTVLWSILRLQSSTSGRVPIILHVIDLTWVAAITTATGGIASPLITLFLFVLVEAAYRWGFGGTIATAVATLLFIGIQSAVAPYVSPTVVVAGVSTLKAAGPIDVATSRAIYLALAGLLVGYITGREKNHRDECQIISRLTTMVRAELGMMGSLKKLFPALLELFGARAILLVAQEPRKGRLFLWQQDDSSDMEIASGELVPSERDVYLFPMDGEAWHAVSAASGLRPTVQVFSLESDGRMVENISSPIPESFAERHPFFSLFGVSLSFGSEWDDRFFLLDPAGDVRQLPFLLRLVRQLGPALQSVYVQGRLNSRVGEMERARLARELHDSTVQSLIGLEMELAAWRRSFEHPPTTNRISAFQQRVHEEVVKLRELMQQLRPVHVEPPKLLRYLSEVVDRFQRETGISAVFEHYVEDIDISQEVCCGLIRILQEALVNVRKHSGAHNVLVRFRNDDGLWSMKIDDDGCGFGFLGRRHHVELDTTPFGPAVIKERVRGLAGELIVDSNPRRGTRLEVTVPGAAHV